MKLILSRQVVFNIVTAALLNKAQLELLSEIINRNMHDVFVYKPSLLFDSKLCGYSLILSV